MKTRCRWCEYSAVSETLGHCQRCWNVWVQIRQEPELALDMLFSIARENGKFTEFDK